MFANAFNLRCTIYMFIICGIKTKNKKNLKLNGSVNIQNYDVDLLKTLKKRI